MNKNKRLYRKKSNRMLLGVCAGIADYFEIDPTIIRVLWVIVSFAGGCGLLAYFVCAIIMPLDESND